MSRSSPFYAKKFIGPTTFATMLVSNSSSGAGSTMRLYKYYARQGVSADQFISNQLSLVDKERANYWLKMFN